MSDHIITVYSELHASPQPLCVDLEKKIHGHDSEREQHKAKGLEFLDPAALDLLMVNDIWGHLQALWAGWSHKPNSHSKQVWGEVATMDIWG